MFNFKYLDKAKLRGLDKYKYCSIDNSPLSVYVMHPFWNQLVKLCPKWVAPNVLTLSGFLFTVVNAILLTYYDFDFTASSDTLPATSPIPNWVWLICAVNHFLSHNLDGIDGKQARRTGSSGPLGELFDHGLDSWATLFIPLSIYSMFGRAELSYPPMRIFFIFWSIFITFYFAHWEKYNTGVLYLPWSYDFTQLALTFMYLGSYFQSYRLWKHMLPVVGCSAGQMFEYISHTGSLILTVPFTIYNVYMCYRAGSLKRSILLGLEPLISFVLLFVLTTAWAMLSPNDVLEIDARVYFFMVGTAFSQISCRLIVDQMSSARCEKINWTIYAIAGALVAVLAVEPSLANELMLLRLLAVLIAAGHLHYGICVVRQLCVHFRINCFSITKRVSTKN